MANCILSVAFALFYAAACFGLTIICALWLDEAWFDSAFRNLKN